MGATIVRGANNIQVIAPPLKSGDAEEQRRNEVRFRAQMQDELAGVHKMVGDLSRRIFGAFDSASSLVPQLEALSSDLGGITAALDSIDPRVGTLETEFAGIVSQLEALDLRVAELEKNVGDFDIKLAEAEVLSTYGVPVSVLARAESFRQFGTCDDIGTTIRTVWEVPVADETYVDSNIIDTISSSHASDVRSVVIEGYTVSGTGVDAVFIESTQTVTTNGQTKVTLTTPLARVTRFTTTNIVSNLGDIYIYEDTAITAGVPTDLTKVHMAMRVGRNLSAKAAAVVSGTDYMIISSVYGSVVEKVAATVDFTLEVRPVGGVFRAVRYFTASDSSGQVYQPIKPHLVVPKNADVRIRALASGANTSVSAGFDGYLAGIVF